MDLGATDGNTSAADRGALCTELANTAATVAFKSSVRLVVSKEFSSDKSAERNNTGTGSAASLRSAFQFKMREYLPYEL
jgi:hypothetical protein